MNRLYESFALPHGPPSCRRRADHYGYYSPPLGAVLFTVLQEKLGLCLERRQAPVDIYVIDHIARVPIGN